VADIEGDQLDVGTLQYPSSDSLDDFIESPSLRSDNGDTDSGSLPGIMMIDFGRRQLHAASQVIEDGTQTPTLLLERRATGKPQFQFDGGGVHRPELCS
jgi:hypothetical protein